jgi:hypothetical protein
MGTQVMCQTGSMYKYKLREPVKTRLLMSADIMSSYNSRCIDQLQGQSVEDIMSLITLP